MLLLPVTCRGQLMTGLRGAVAPAFSQRPSQGVDSSSPQDVQEHDDMRPRITGCGCNTGQCQCSRAGSAGTVADEQTALEGALLNMTKELEAWWHDQHCKETLECVCTFPAEICYCHPVGKPVVNVSSKDEQPPAEVHHDEALLNETEKSLTDLWVGGFHAGGFHAGGFHVGGYYGGWHAGGWRAGGWGAGGYPYGYPGAWGVHCGHVGFGGCGCRYAGCHCDHVGYGGCGGWY